MGSVCESTSLNAIYSGGSLFGAGGGTCTRHTNAGHGNSACFSGVGISSRTATTWLTVAHELGHNFGAQHNTGGTGQPIYGDGIMSYGTVDPQNGQRKEKRFYQADASGWVERSVQSAAIGLTSLLKLTSQFPPGSVCTTINSKLLSRPSCFQPSQP